MLIVFHDLHLPKPLVSGRCSLEEQSNRSSNVVSKETFKRISLFSSFLVDATVRHSYLNRTAETGLMNVFVDAWVRCVADS